MALIVELWAWSSESLGESRHCVQIFRAPAALLNSPPALPCSCCIFYTQQCIWWTTLQGTVEDQWRKPLATRQTQVPVKTPPCPPLSWWAKAPSLVKVAQTQNALIISQVQVFRWQELTKYLHTLRGQNMRLFSSDIQFQNVAMRYRIRPRPLIKC